MVSKKSIINYIALIYSILRIIVNILTMYIVIKLRIIFKIWCNKRKFMKTLKNNKVPSDLVNELYKEYALKLKDFQKSISIMKTIKILQFKE